jgi:hypothetical protein
MKFCFYGAEIFSVAGTQQLNQLRSSRRLGGILNEVSPWRKEGITPTKHQFTRIAFDFKSTNLTYAEAKNLKSIGKSVVLVKCDEGSSSVTRRSTAVIFWYDTALCYCDMTWPISVLHSWLITSMSHRLAWKVNGSWLSSEDDHSGLTVQGI